MRGAVLHDGQTLNLQIYHSANFVLGDDAWGRVLMFHLSSDYRLWENHLHQYCCRALVDMSALSLLSLTSHASALILLYHTDLSCLLYESRACSCKFCFDLIRTIKLWLCRSDTKQSRVGSIFNGSTWGVTFQWLQACSINTMQKKLKKGKEGFWETVRREVVFLFQLCTTLQGFFR